jgi:hypothetical protein
MERPLASQPPRYNHLHRGGARANAAVRNQLNYSQNVSPAPGSRQPQPRSKTASQASRHARAKTQPPPTKLLTPNRDHVASRLDRRSQTRPVAISIFVDAARHEHPLTKTLLSHSRSAQRSAAKRRAQLFRFSCWLGGALLAPKPGRHAEQHHTRWSSGLRLAIAHRRRKPRARGRQSPAPRTTRPAGRDLTPGKIPRAKPDNTKRGLQQRSLVSARGDPMHDREPRPFPRERPLASKPPR